MGAKFRRVILWGLFLTLVPYAGFTAEEDEEEDKPLIRDKAQTEKVERLPPVNTGGETKTVASSLANVPPESKAGFMELISRLNQLENEIRQLRGELETATHELKTLQQRNSELYKDMDTRIREVEGQKGTSTSTNTTKKGGTETTTGDLTETERADYEKAFKLLRESRNDQAIAGFKEYIKKYPSGKFADTAHYWLGEAYYVTQNYKAAIEQYNKVVEGFPDSAKVVGSKVKVGFAYYEMKNFTKSKQVLQDVIRRHPKHSSAKIAKQRLQQMTKEGR